VLAWKVDFERLDVPEELKRLRSLASSLCDSMVAEIEEFTSRLKALTAEAVRAARAGQKAEIVVTLYLTPPNRTEMMKEFDRVMSLYSSGALKWE
jgi:hypothetical protein